MAGKKGSDIASSIASIMLAKDKRGELKYSRQERRDFAVWCVLNLGLPVTPEIQPIMLEFMGQFELPNDISDEQAAQAVDEYFKQYPLNKELVAAMSDWGRKEMLTGDKGYKDRGEQLKALRQVGKAEPLKAPKDTPKKKKPKVKSGLK